MILHPQRTFDAAAFPGFLADQPDMGTKWAPRYIRVSTDLPQTPSNKILKRVLRNERWECADDVYLRGDDGAYAPITGTDVAQIATRFAERGKAGELE